MKPIVVNMNDVAAQEIAWLWPNMLPKGKLVLLCGDPGLGKSFITLDLCSRASRGGPWPFDGVAGPVGAPMRSVLLSAEDDPADTIRPRLERMGADLRLIDILEGLTDGQDRVHDFVIGEHSRDLVRLLEDRPDTGLIVVDPVSAYVGASDSYNNAQVRGMLKPLADLAADYGVCVVLVTHLRKSEAAKLLHAAMGSLAFTAAARVVLLVGRDPNDATLRYLLTVKSNLASDRLGFRYRLTDGRVEWVERVVGQADEILGQRPRGRGGAGGGGAGAAGGAGGGAGGAGGGADGGGEGANSGPWSGGDSGGSSGAWSGGGAWGHTTDAKRRQGALFQELKGAIAQRGEIPSTEVEEMARRHGVSWSLLSRGAFKKSHGVRSLKRETGWVWIAAAEEDGAGSGLPDSAPAGLRQSVRDDVPEELAGEGSVEPPGPPSVFRGEDDGC